MFHICLYTTFIQYLFDIHFQHQACTLTQSTNRQHFKHFIPPPFPKVVVQHPRCPHGSVHLHFPDYSKAWSAWSINQDAHHSTLPLIQTQSVQDHSFHARMSPVLSVEAAKQKPHSPHLLALRVE